MARIVILSLLVCIMVSCKNTYVATSSGLDNDAAVIVLRDNNSQPIENLTIILDGDSILYDEVQKEKNLIKAIPVKLSPGEHQVTIKYEGKALFEDKIYLGNSESRKIILP